MFFFLGGWGWGGQEIRKNNVRAVAFSDLVSFSCPLHGPRTRYAACGEFAATYSLYQPQSDECEDKVDEGGDGGEPDHSLFVLHPGHPDDCGAVIPA